MDTKSISSADFIRHFGRYHDEAQHAPLALTKHGRPSVVVVPAEMFERLMQRDDPRHAYGSGETPDDLAELLLGELDRQSAEYHAQDEN